MHTLNRKELRLPSGEASRGILGTADSKGLSSEKGSGLTQRERSFDLSRRIIRDAQNALRSLRARILGRMLDCQRAMAPGWPETGLTVWFGLVVTSAERGQPIRQGDDGTEVQKPKV